MRDYIIRRTLLFVPTVIGVTLLIFIVLRVLPGDPLRVVLGAEGSVAYILSDEELANARASLGLDKPLYQQYLGWLADIAQGDLGNSFWREAPLSRSYLQTWPDHSTNRGNGNHTVLGFGASRRNRGSA